MQNRFPYYQYNQQQPFNAGYDQPQQYLKGRQVTSIDEAKASIIDFDGSVFYFPDNANKCIYSKQINMDGTSSIRVYKEIPTPIENTSSFVTKEELASYIEKINQEIKQLQKGEVKDDKQQLQF